jgi:hypothetical protein
MAVNQIRLGRVHTVHEPSGRLAFQGFYVQTGAALDRTTLTSERHFNIARDAERKTRRFLLRIRSETYRQEMKQALVRYTRALDGGDHDSVLLRFWSLLEF